MHHRGQASMGMHYEQEGVGMYELRGKPEFTTQDAERAIKRLLGVDVRVSQVRASDRSGYVIAHYSKVGPTATKGSGGGEPTVAFAAYEDTRTGKVTVEELPHPSGPFVVGDHVIVARRNGSKLAPVFSGARGVIEAFTFDPDDLTDHCVVRFNNPIIYDQVRYTHFTIHVLDLQLDPDTSDSKDQAFDAALLDLLRRMANAGMSAAKIQDTFWECYKVVKPVEAAKADRRRRDFEDACGKLTAYVNEQLSIPAAIRRARAAQLRRHAEELGIFKPKPPASTSGTDDRCDHCKEYDKDGCYNCGPLTIAKVFNPAPDPPAVVPIVDIDPTASRVWACDVENEGHHVYPSYMCKYRSTRVTPEFSKTCEGWAWWVPNVEKVEVMTRLADDGYTVASSSAPEAFVRLCVRTTDELPQMEGYRTGKAVDPAWKVYWVPADSIEAVLARLIDYETSVGSATEFK